MDIVIYFGLAVDFFRWRDWPAQDISQAVPVDCKRLRKADYSSYEFTVDLGKPNDKYEITDRQLSVYHYKRIRFLMYKKYERGAEASFLDFVLSS